MNRVLTGEEFPPLWTTELLTERTSAFLQDRVALTKHARKVISRALGITEKAFDKLVYGDRPPSGVIVMRMIEYFGPAFIEELRKCPDETRQEVLNLLAEMEERVRQWT